MAPFHSTSQRYELASTELEDKSNTYRPSLAWRLAPTGFSSRSWIIHAMIFALSVLSGAIVARSRGECSSWHTEVAYRPCPIEPHVTQPSTAAENPASISSFEMPVFDMDYKLQEVRFSGSVNVKSPFKGPPSAAVDAAWDSIWADNMVVSSEEYEASRPQFPQAGVKAANREQDSYFATFEATHQLHCLYTLFRASYVDYYKPEREFLLHDPDRYHARLDHCTDMLRQKLMCDSDSGIVTYNWVRDEDGPVADYSVLHHCRNHDVLLTWANEHAATGVKFNKNMSASVLESEP